MNIIGLLKLLYEILKSLNKKTINNILKSKAMSFIFILLLSTILSSVIVLAVSKKYIIGNIPDIVKISDRHTYIKKSAEDIKERVCKKLHLEATKCPIKIRSFIFQYSTELNKFGDYGWCMGQQSDVQRFDYLSRKKIHTDLGCKNFLQQQTHSFLSKSDISYHCPALSEKCIFNTTDNQDKYAFMSCNSDKIYQGVTCFAMVDGENIEKYRLYESNKSISETLKDELSKLSFFNSSLFPYDVNYM